jgi:hypothetical protein
LKQTGRRKSATGFTVGAGVALGRLKGYSRNEKKPRFCTPELGPRMECEAFD